MSDIPMSSEALRAKEDRPTASPSAKSTLSIVSTMSTSSRSVRAPRRIEFTHACKIPSSTAQQRRMNSRGGYLAPRTAQAKAFWQALFEKYAPDRPLQGPLSVIVLFYYHRPKGSKSQYKTTRPDLDNLMKMAQDAMMHTGYFKDDSQIALLSLGKFNTDDFEGIKYSLEELEAK